MKDQKTRRLAAIMFTDIVGYTALMHKDEKGAAKIRAHHREVFQQQHQLHQGEIVQYYGDGTLSVFQSAIEAVQCAIEIQQLLQQENPVPLRIGLHMGDIVFNGTEVYGDGVNFASRIESMGIEGAILLSGKLNDELRNHQDISTLSLGHFELKNIAEPVEVFAVSNEGIKIPKRSQLKGKRKKLTKTIAVLPFVNMSSNEDNEYFSDGMTEEIINALSKINGLKVTSRTSSFFFKNKSIPIPQVGQELNVSTILEGSIRLSGNMMRITAQLINVADDVHFWSETFDRTIDNIFVVQDEISLLIADKLREHIGHFEIKDQLVETPNVPVEIYKRFLKGRYYLLKMNMSDVEKGISILKDVIKDQPDFPLAYVGVHQGYTFLGAVGLLSASESFEKGNPYLDKAIELDKDLPECQLSIAGIKYWRDWDIDGSFQHLNKALEIRPAYADAFQSMAPTLATVGKNEAALSYINKAIQLDPFSAMNHYIKGLVYYFQEKHEKAIVSYKKSISLDPDFLFAKMLWACSLLLKGEYEKGLEIYRNFPSDKFGSLAKLGGLTTIYAAMKDKEKTEEGLRELEKELHTESMGWVIHFLILIHTINGSEEEAIKLIEKGIAHRLPMMLTFAPDPMFKPLHSNPRFQELMQQVLGKEHFQGFSKKKYKKSSLKNEAVEKYYLRLEQYMANEKPYLLPNLTLRKLAEMVDLHPNYLSQLLNEKFGKNFSDFINQYRVEHFKQIAKDPQNTHLSLLGLAFDSGFNSKTVFNTFFKKETGVTPKQWVKSVNK